MADSVDGYESARRDQAFKNAIAAENKHCQLAGHIAAEAIRYTERSTVERVSARLKEELGGRVVNV